MALPPPDIQMSVPVTVPETGTMTSYFSDWLTRTLSAIITQTNSNTSIIATLQAQQKQILAQQQQIIAANNAANNASGGTAGNAQGNFSSLTTSVWTNGPTVSLTGVAAGNLTIFGSGPTQDNSTGVNAISGVLGDFTGDWRIVEIVGAVETVVFSGFWHGERDRDDAGIENIFYNTTDTSTVSIPATSTGAVDYRLDFRSPSCDITSALLYLAVVRS